jgi:hypothetical protein
MSWPDGGGGEGMEEKKYEIFWSTYHF